MIKVAIIGAGSIGFTRKVMADILCVPALRDTVFTFMDINERNLEAIVELAQRDISDNEVKANARIESTLDQREAITDADYVVNAARVGGVEAFRHDVEIPLKYGVDQCVGDTIAPGGIMYGQRGIPVILGICRDILEVAKPDCILLNHGNPNAMLTWAANHYGGVQCIGLCHGVQGGHAKIAGVIGAPKEELDIICAGINHQTWYIQLRHKGREITGEELLEAFEKNPDQAKIEKCRIDVLRRTGYFSTESNGHLSEYLPWYRKRADDIHNWVSTDKWIHGETCGYYRHTHERRNWFDAEYPSMLKKEVNPFTTENRSHEHSSRIIESLETGVIYRGHFNVVNDGCISNLPDDAVVEVPGYVGGNGIGIPKVGDLPDICAAICSASISVQRLAVKAALDGDVKLLKQAMMIDPLTAAVCSTPEISQMTDEMLVALAPWMPQYTEAVPLAKKRLQSEETLGTKGTEGFARLKKPVESETTESADELLTDEEQ